MRFMCREGRRRKHQREFQLMLYSVIRDNCLPACLLACLLACLCQTWRQGAALAAFCSLFLQELVRFLQRSQPSQPSTLRSPCDRSQSDYNTCSDYKCSPTWLKQFDHHASTQKVGRRHYYPSPLHSLPETRDFYFLRESLMSSL